MAPRNCRTIGKHPPRLAGGDEEAWSSTHLAESSHLFVRQATVLGNRLAKRNELGKIADAHLLDSTPRFTNDSR
jgi:hypothetical protein